VRDPYLSGSVWFGSIWSAHRRRSPEPDVLESVISAFRANRSAYRDLPDDFAYEEGGFSVAMSPETVKHLVESLRRRSVPMTLFWQHLPGAEQFADTPLEPEDVLLWRITRSLDAYHGACNASA